jgi:hypothetical protein
VLCAEYYYTAQHVSASAQALQEIAVVCSQATCTASVRVTVQVHQAVDISKACTMSTCIIVACLSCLQRASPQARGPLTKLGRPANVFKRA